MSHPYRAAYLLVEQPAPRRGSGASRRAFYRLYIYNYELSRRLKCDKHALTYIRNNTKNRDKKVVLALQWYLLIAEELIDSIYDQADAKTPREAFDRLGVEETLQEVEQSLRQLLPPTSRSARSGADLTQEFSLFFQSLDANPPLGLHSKNAEVRHWVRDYQQQHTAQINTLDPADYSSKLKVMDQEFASLLTYYQTALNEWPEEGLPLLLLTIVMLFVPLTELLSYAELVEVEFGEGVPAEGRSLLAFYAALNPKWSIQLLESGEGGALRTCQEKLNKSFGLYNAQRLFPLTLECCDTVVARLPLDHWAAYRLPTVTELQTLQEAIRAHQMDIVFSVLSQSSPESPVGCWTMYQQAGFMALFTSGLSSGELMLKAHRLRRALGEYVALALELLLSDTWDEVLHVPKLKQQADEVLTFSEQPEFQQIWATLTGQGGLLERLSQQWHWRRELGEHHCLLDLQEQSPGHLAFVRDWQAALLQIHVDEVLLLRLCRFFEEATRERHSGQQGLLHSAVTMIGSSVHHVPVAGNFPHQDGQVERWRHAADVMGQMKEMQLQREKVVSDWRLEQITSDELDKLLNND